MIKHIHAANFLSWKWLSTEITSGVTLIDGWNEDDQTSEGSGKSAILNAISWCLYGKIPKEAKMDDVIKHGEKSCDVEVVFDDGTVIKRTRGPNTLEIFDSNNKSQKGKDARETQTIIEEYVGLTFETFCQTVYFAQNYTKKFITSNQEDKAKILSEVQDLKVFDRSRKETMDLLKKNERQLTDLTHQLAMHEKDYELKHKDIEAEKARIEYEKNQFKQRVQSIQERLESERAELKKAEQTHKEISEAVGTYTYDQSRETALLADYETLTKSNAILDTQRKDYETAKQRKNLLERQCKSSANRYKELQKQSADLEAFIKDPTDTCKACGTTLTNVDTSHAQSHLQAASQEMEKIKAELVRLTPELDTPLPSKEGLETQIQENTTKQKQIEAEINQLRQTKDKMLKAGTVLQQLDQTIKQKNANMVDLKNMLVKIPHPQVDEARLTELMQQQTVIKDSIADLSNLITQKRQYVAQLEILKTGFKDIKSYVFNAILNEINARVHQYLSHLFEVPVTVRFRNESMKIETDVTFDGAERGLGLLSGGQFRRVSLAVDLALSDVITARKGARLGVLILDEYFKDLSESSMEKCLTLLESRGQPVLLIEHNSIFKNIVNNTLMVRLEGGTSSVES